jgi:hypothetical protein
MYGTQEEITNRVTEAVSTILDALNGTSSREVKEMVLKRLLREHRTLQQSFWSMITLMLIDYANAPNDLRNEMAVRLATKFKEMAEKNNFDYGLPMY